MQVSNEIKDYKLIYKSVSGDMTRVLLTDLQYKTVLGLIQAKKEYITLTEIDLTIPRRSIQEISRLKASERSSYSQNTPITVEENLYIIDNLVQKYKGESIWLEVRKQGEVTLSSQKIVYMPMPDGNTKRIYI